MRNGEGTGTAAPALNEWLSTVLVVDDDPLVRELLQFVLRRHGFEVWVAANGRDAVERYHELQRQNWKRNVVVLLDVQMPGLDGPLVLAALRALDPEVRAYFMTGDPGAYGGDELLAAGARRVFAKPLDFSAVVADLRYELAPLSV